MSAEAVVVINSGAEAPRLDAVVSGGIWPANRAHSVRVAGTTFGRNT